MLLKIFHFLLNLTPLSLNCTIRFSFFICTQMFECCHFPRCKVLLRSLCGYSFPFWCSSGGAFSTVLEKKLGELHCIFLWIKMVKSSIFHVQNHVLHELALCCWRNKAPEIYKPALIWFTCCTSPILQAWMSNQKRPIRCSVGTELRIEISAWGLQ